MHVHLAGHFAQRQALANQPPLRALADQHEDEATEQRPHSHCTFATYLQSDCIEGWSVAQNSFFLHHSGTRKPSTTSSNQFERESIAIYTEELTCQPRFISH